MQSTNQYPAINYFVCVCVFVCVCDKMLFQICTYLTINELIFHWSQSCSISTRWSKVDHCEIWSFVKCGFLPSSCISQFVIMEIIDKHYKLRIEHFSHSLGKISDYKWTPVNCWQYMSLNVSNDYFIRKKWLFDQNTFEVKKPSLRKMPRRCSAAIYVSFPHHLCSHQLLR